MSKYDAFISYRHVAQDSWVAEQIHKGLEHYHIPRSIREKTGKKRINRVFRDLEELKLASDLTGEIYQALDDSEFLIVICSPAIKETQWVNKEVEYFLTNHSMDQVMLVVAEGNPKEVFPDVIQNIQGNRAEHLAANVQGKTKRISKKKIKTELLRIMATMLGVSYDDLKQRHKEYRRKQMGAVMTSLMLVGGAFWGYSAYQNYQLALAAQEKLENAAELACDTALEKYRSGDRNGALATILSVRDAKNADKLVLPKQSYVLNEVLNSYQTGDYIEYRPSSTVGSEITESCFSGNGEFLLALNKEKEIICYSVEEECELWKLDKKDFDDKIAEEKENYYEFATGSASLLLPYGDDKLVVLCPYAVMVIAAGTGQIEETFSVNVSVYSEKNAEIKEDILTLWSDARIYRYDLNTGENILSLNVDHILKLTDEDHTSDFYYSNMLLIYCLDINEDETKVVFGVENTSDSDKKIKGLFLYDITEASLLCLNEMAVEEALFVDNDHPAGMMLTTSERFDTGLYDLYVTVYDSETGEEVASSGKITGQGYKHGIKEKHFYNGQEDFLGVVFYLGNTIYFLDVDYGELIGQIDYGSPIIHISDWENNSILVAAESGWLQRVKISNSIYRTDFLYNIGDIEHINADVNTESFSIRKNGQEIFYKISKDEELTYIEYTAIDDIHKGAGIEVLEGGMFAITDAKKTSLTILCSTANEQLYSFTCQEGNCISVYSFVEEERPWLYILEKKQYSSEKEEEYLIHRVDWESKEDSILDLTDELEMKPSIILYNSKYKKVICDNGFEKMYLLSFDEDKITDRKEITMDNGLITCASLSKDERYLFFRYVVDSKYFCRVYDFETDEFSEMDELDKKTEKISRAEVIMGEQDSKMCLYAGEIAYVIDLSKKEILSEIPIKISMLTSNAAFFHNSQYLLFSGSGRVLLYDAETGAFINSVSYDARSDSVLGVVDGNLLTDRNGKYFCIRNTGYSGSDIHGRYHADMIVFSVGENQEIYPFAEVLYGTADFSAERILVDSGNRVYSAPFYEETLLIQKAEALLR